MDCKTSIFQNYAINSIEVVHFVWPYTMAKKSDVLTSTMDDLSQTKALVKLL